MFFVFSISKGFDLDAEYTPLESWLTIEGVAVLRFAPLVTVGILFPTVMATYQVGSFATSLDIDAVCTLFLQNMITIQTMI